MNLEPALLFHTDTVQHPPTAPGMRKSVPLHWWAGIFSRIWKYSVSASYNWDTMATCCPLSLWPRTGPWDADVPSTMPLSAINAEVTTVCQVSKSSCHPWRLSGVIAKFSHSFYSGGAKLPIFFCIITEAMTQGQCLVNQNSAFYVQCILALDLKVYCFHFMFH